MKNKIPVRINIAERLYPMKIVAEDEVKIRKTAQKLNKELLSFESDFKIQDKFDAIAMVAFDSLLSLEKEKDSFIELENKIDKMIADLEEFGF